jgi:peroxiredoxin family protein
MAISTDRLSKTVSAPDVSALEALVRAEVERQLGGLRGELERQIGELRERTPDNRATLVVFSGDLDKTMAAFIIATGAAAAGLETSMFFTFWGLSLLKKRGATSKKTFKQKMFSLMTPSDSTRLGTSKMSFFGLGAAMLRTMMKESNVSSLEELIVMARELGVKMTACTMSMDALGLAKEELVSDIEYAGVATFLADASTSRVSLFI